MDQLTMDAIKLSISIIGALTGTSGLIISLFSSRREKYQVVSEFLSELSDPKFIAAKKYVYTNDTSDVEDEQVAIVVNFFIIGDCLQIRSTFQCGSLTVQLVVVLVAYTNEPKCTLQNGENTIKIIYTQSILNGCIKK